MQASKTSSRLIFLGLLFTILLEPCFALDFEPRQWSHLPIRTNFFGVAYAYTDADISVDPIISLEDVELEKQTWVGRYIRTFELFDKSGRIDVTQGYIHGEWKGLLEDVPASTSRSGLSDTFLRIAFNLYGGPPLQKKEFAAYRSNVEVDTIVGLGLAVRLPTGEYEEDQLINLGQNRFIYRPQVGISHTRGKWNIELTGEVAFHADNDDFFNGKTREQDSTYIIHGHLTHSFRPGVWLGAAIAYDYVGENSIDGVDSDDKKENIGWALRFAYPINRQSGFNVSYIGTRRQKSIGSDSDTLAASLSFSW